MKGITKKLGRILLISVIIFSFAYLSIGVMSDVWWTGTPDFVINETADFDSPAIKLNITTITDRYNQSANTIELDFPYAKKDSNLVSYWRLENNGNDEVGTNTATVTGATFTSSGKFGGAYSFDGVDDDISVGIGSTLNTPGDMAISVWVYPTVSKLQYIACKQTSTGYNRNYCLLLGATTNGISFIRADGTATQAALGGNTSVILNQWNHIVATDNSKNSRLYLNGVDIGNLTYTFTVTSNNNPNHLGWGSGDSTTVRHFAGIIDEVRYYNRSLSATEVVELYNNGAKYIDTNWGSSQANWTSATQTMTAGNKLFNSTINLTTSDSNYNITKIEWLKSSDSSILASNETDITTTGLVTYSDANGLDSGDFDNIVGDFKVKIYLDGNGTDTPVIDDVIGSYEARTAGLTFTWLGTTSSDWSTVSNWDQNAVPTSIDYVVLDSAPANQPVLTANTNVFNLTIPASASLNTSGYNLQLQNYIDVLGLLNVSGGKLIFNGTNDGDCQLNVSSGGTLLLLDSANLTSGDTDEANYGLYLAPGSVFNANDSYIRRAGYEAVKGHYGIDIYNASVNMDNVTINDMDYYGLYLSGADVGNYSNLTIAVTRYAFFMNSYNDYNTISTSNILAQGPDPRPIFMNSYNDYNVFTRNNLTLISSSSNNYAYWMYYDNDYNNFTYGNITSNRYGIYSQYTQNAYNRIEYSNIASTYAALTARATYEVYANNYFNVTNDKILFLTGTFTNITDTVADSSYYGADVTYAQDCNIRNVTINAPGAIAFGITFTGTAAGHSYNNNITNVTLNSANGISANNYTYNNYIVNTTITATYNDLVGVGIGAAGGNLTLENCTITDPEVNGTDYVFAASNTVDFFIKYNEQVHVLSADDGSDINAATVTITDNTGASVFSDTSGADGLTGYQLLSAYTINATGTFENGLHTVSATVAGYAPGNQRYNLTSNKTGTLDLYLGTTGNVWQGGTSDDWSDFNNWGRKTPPSSIDYVFLNASATYQPNLTTNSNVYNISIPASTILANDGYNLQVENIIDVSGLLNVSGGKLIFNGTDDGACQLNVNSGGTLWANDQSNLTNENTPASYFLVRIYDGGNFNASDSYFLGTVMIIYAHNTNLTNNTISGDSSEYTLYFSSATNSQIVNNNINLFAPSDYAITLTSSPSNNFTGNNVNGSAFRSMLIYSSSPSNNFTGNNFTGTNYNFNNAGADNCIYIDNNISSNNGYSYYESGADDNVYINNTFISTGPGATSAGAYISGTRNDFHNNTFKQTGLGTAAAGAIVVGANNNFTGDLFETTVTGKYAIYLSGSGSHDNNFTNVNASGSTTNYGVAIYNGAYNNYIINSTISGGTNDIYGVGASAGNLTLENCSFDDTDYLFGTGNTDKVYVKYYLNTSVYNTSSVGVPSVTLTIDDVDSTEVFSGTASINGDTGYQLVQAYMRNKTGIFENTPHTITSASGTYDTIVYDSNSTIWNMTGNGTSTVSLLAPTTALESYITYSAETYQTDNNSRSHFIENEIVRIFANVTSDYTANISIVDSGGTRVVDRQEMSNFTNTTNRQWWYDYQINGTIGYYNVTVGNTTFENLFYRGDAWVYTNESDIANSTWRNSTSVVYPFRVELNISELNSMQRYWEVVDTWVNFSDFGAHNSSVRVGAYNGTYVFEIPSQVYNQTITDTTMNYANVVFLMSLNASQNRTYYIYYSRNDVGLADYDTDLTYSNSTNVYSMENKNYKIETVGSSGGVLDTMYDKVGSNTILEGFSPMQYSPDAKPAAGTCDIVSNTSPYVIVEQGDVFIRYAVDAQSTSACIYKVNYDLIYTVYANTPYFLVETNVTSQSSGITWDYIDQKMFYNGSNQMFTNLTYLTSAGSVLIKPVTNGDGANLADLGDIQYIGFYNNTTCDATADLFIQEIQSNSSTPDVDYFDDANYEYYTRTIIASHVASANDYFYTKVGRMIYRGIEEAKLINETYYQLVTPVNQSLSAHRTYDTEAPQNVSINYTPASPTSLQDVICYSNWTDNLDIDYAIITENSTGINVEHIVTIDGTLTGEANWTMYAANFSSINSAPAYVLCDIVAYDIAGNTNTSYVYIPITDARAPMISNILYNPNSTDQVDPYVSLNITANVTDYATIDTVILQYRANNTGAWINQTMNHSSERNEANVTMTNFTEYANYTIQIIANDTSGNSNTSDATNISVAYDTTWSLIPTSWGEVYSTIAQSKSVVNLTVNNTGDYELYFTMATINYPSAKVSYNITNTANFNVSNGTSLPVEVIFIAQITPTINPANISVTANQSTDSERTQHSAGTFYSIASGPYLYLTVPTYNSSASAGDTISLSGKMENVGDTVAQNPWTKWTLPSGWTLVSGPITELCAVSETTNVSCTDLSPYAALAIWNNITVIIPSDATGANTFTFEANCTEGANYTMIVTVTVSGTVPETSCGDGSCNGGETYTTCPADCEAPSTSPGGGGGGAVSIGGSSDKLFQTSEIFEMVRGEDSSFPLTIENPFTNSTMENVTIKVTGLLSKYVTVFPEKLSKLSPKNSYNFTIKINA
ncbi:MAG: right-handed parallel beta-helix repeat-containing protein, partial [Nanoarchaeota archaeon]|nr:right-handed parallel beta-helix repeat-containing protein [Nanoarchaeota archaeon]MBU4124608.1 right-handed parallel beta-helix repeat-containing protein [Nanoarchaeota archaeon]